jgi:hypothetical protein
MPKLTVQQWSKLFFLCLLIGSAVLIAGTTGLTAADDLSLALASNSLRTYTASSVSCFADNWQQMATKIASQAVLELRTAPSLVGEFNRYVSNSDPATFVEINPTNQTILLSKGVQNYQTAGATPDLPKGAAATSFAEKYLKDMGLYPAEPAQLVQLEQGGVMLGVYNKKTGEQADYQKTTTLRFTRILDGLPVEGPGSRIVINLGAAGSLEGLVWNWHEVTGQTVAATEIRSQSQLQALIKKQLDKMDGLQNSTQKLVLYDDGSGNIEPVLHVTATLAITDNAQSVSTLADFYVPVLKTTQTKLATANMKEPARATR